ncbi:MAG TPA: phosphatase PAP2 family protein [Candidatus Aenigmarchaeota archaeon]|nr:MAG: hypothetical protein DRP03_02920 [Candidatus Aenigmarchaeota archaeon]HDD46189.1 phosphatase PAP2 family protein [Candidatus Aenigmarchaeota archaeon]
MNIWYLLTLFGGIYFLLFLLLLTWSVYLYKRFIAKAGKKETRHAKTFALYFSFALLLTYFFVIFLKSSLHIERPCIPCTNNSSMCNPYCPLDSSFPSGHTSGIFSAITAFTIFYRRKKYCVLYLLPALVGVSRYMLHVHTLFDIMGGALIGILVPSLLYPIFRSYLTKT